MDPVVQEMHDQSIIPAIIFIIALVMVIRAIIKKTQKLRSLRKEYKALKQQQKNILVEYFN